MNRKYLNLRLFGDGADGGTSAGDGAEGTTIDSGENFDIPANIPEKAKGAYREALKKTAKVTASKPAEATSSEVSNVESKPAYADLIKSDDYKEEHKAYMEKTLNDRLKKYKGVEDDNAKMRATLETIATKYGLDATADSFLDDISSAVAGDNAYFEDYAMSHDISVEQAKANLSMERRLAAYEANEQAQRQQEQMQREFAQIQANAAKTKQMYPEFDLEACLQDANFARICKATMGDTTAAYIATHWQSEIPRQVQMASKQAEVQMANTVKANMSRPIENGLSSHGAIVATPNFSGMTAKEMREYAYANLKK